MKILIKVMVSVFLCHNISISMAMEEPGSREPDQSTSRKRKTRHEPQLGQSPEKTLKRSQKSHDHPLNIAPSSLGEDVPLTSFEGQPAEVIAHIMSFLSPKDLARMALTSKKNGKIVENLCQEYSHENQSLFPTATMPWQTTYFFRMTLIQFFKEYQQKSSKQEPLMNFLEKYRSLAQFCKNNKLPHRLLLQKLWTENQQLYPLMTNFSDAFMKKFLNGVYLQNPIVLELGLLMHHFSITLYHSGSLISKVPFRNDKPSYLYYIRLLAQKEKVAVLHELAKNFDEDLLLEIAEHFYQTSLPFLEKEAVYFWRLAAAKGNAEALFSLGFCYTKGHGVARDRSEALKLHQLAAEKGHIGAQLRLGFFYYNEATPRNLPEATRWFRLAADQGDSEALVALGFCYYDGLGVMQNQAEALKLYLLAAEKNNRNAQFLLGQHYLRCEPRNLKEAFKWFQLASMGGHPEAQGILGQFYHGGIAVDQNLTEAFAWYKLSADQGHPTGQYLLGECYRLGIGVEKNIHEAVRLYRLSADQGNSEGLYAMGERYRRGQGVDKDSLKSVGLYKQAAEKGHLTSQFLVGMYYYREGEARDLAQAVKWLRVAALKGHTKSQFMLGQCYYLGQGVPQDSEEAKKWYQLAANRGNLKAQQKLAGLKQS
jgi:TPR repeat protein